MIGKSIQIDRESYTVVGVMGKDFKYPFSVELWMPLAMDAKEKAIRKSHYLFALGQLKPGATVSQARAELVAINARLSKEYPQTNKGWGVRVMPFRQAVSGDLTRQYTLLLMGAVGFVLLIACANIANLQLARAANRQKEIALRSAMGATRWRVVRQLLTESVLMAVAGGTAGLMVAQWAIDLMLSNMPPDVAQVCGRMAGNSPGFARVSFYFGDRDCGGNSFGARSGAGKAQRPISMKSLKEGGTGFFGWPETAFDPQHSGGCGSFAFGDSAGGRRLVGERIPRADQCESKFRAQFPADFPNQLARCKIQQARKK